MKKMYFFLSVIMICLVSIYTQASSRLLAPEVSKKVLVVYFSHSGNTREIANQIHGIVGGDMFEIRTAKPYPNLYEAMVERARQEKTSGYRPPLTAKVDQIAAYDVIFLGYPIWWDTLPAPVITFLSGHDLSGKTIIPFCTHAGSSWGQSLTEIAALAPQSVVQPNGFAVEGKNAKAARPDVHQWLKDIYPFRPLRLMSAN